jgi:CBS domain-containing protein
VPVASAGTTVRNAVSLMLEANAGRVLVVSDEGVPLGVLPLERAAEVLR